MVKSKDNPPRNTSVVVVKLKTSEVYVIVSLSTQNDTQVIYIDPTTGLLRYQGKIGHDIFASEEEALNYVTEGSKWAPESITYASAILGYAAFGGLGLLLIAKKLEATISNLPGGGCIYTVTESQWIRAKLQYALPQGKGELKNIEDLTDIDIDGKHYFCETRDITRPFPSRMPVDNPDKEFVWNEFLSKPFKEIGLPHHCVTLLQGFADSRSLGLTSIKGGIVALLARRSRLHPGTRYLARGLNACFSTGNEAECEQLLWVSPEAGQTTRFSSYIWRRGTIPLWWGAELKMTAAEAEIYVSSQDPYRGSTEYYQRLSKRYGVRNSGLVIDKQKKNSLVPIVCINLLRSGEGKSETILVEHFAECINYVKSSGKVSFTQLFLKNFDWHTNVKMKGEQETIEDLWKHLKTPTMSIRFREGIYLPSLQQLAQVKGGSIIENDDINGGFHLTGLQNGVIRFNCADSLDRTNAASYFGCLQVFAEQCRHLGICIDRDATSTDSLPEGWAQYTHAETGRIYYANHSTRSTTWERPSTEKPWKRFDMTIDQFKNSTVLYPVNKLSELFLLAGDIHATLYTGSKAMHSQILNIFSDDAGKFKQFSAAQNMKITLTRRYMNLTVDSSRQKQLEMFLGIRMFKHLPSIPVYPMQVLSRPPACFLKSLSNVFPGVKGEPSLLSFKKKDVSWMCSPEADTVELLIYLEEPCHVCEVLITISYGDDDSTIPGRLDIRTGRNLDALDLVVKGAHLPRCSKGTTIIIPVAGPLNDADSVETQSSSSRFYQGDPHLPLLYNFHEHEGNLNFLTRIVLLTFHPLSAGRTPISLGELEVLGVSLPWGRIFSREERSNFFEEVRRHQEAIKSFLSLSDVDHPGNPFLDLNISHSFSGASGDQLNAGGIDLLSGDPVSVQLTLQSDLPLMQNDSSFDNDWSDLLVIPSSVNAFMVPDDKDKSLSHKDNSSGVHHYLNIFQSISNEGQELNFKDAIRLEINRFRAGLSSFERDRALLSVQVNPVSVDPNHLLDDVYLTKISKLADILALLGHSTAEDKILASIGLDTTYHDGVDFWNLNLNGDNCIGSGCEVCYEEQAMPKLNSSKSSSFLCFLCHKKACEVCCAGKGATLLHNYNVKENKRISGSSSQSGSSHGGRKESSSFPIPPDGFICKVCCSEDTLYALYVDYVRTLASLRRRDRVDSAATDALSQIGASWSGADYERVGEGFRTLLKGKDSLAEFPYASFLHSVETDVESEPLLSLLSPLYSVASHSYWRAPHGCTSVELPIVLGALSEVSGVILLVSSCGYSPPFDLPLVTIWAGNIACKEECSFIGKWDLKSLTTISGVSGPENPSNDNVPRHVKFSFPNTVRCRIIWITLALQNMGSSSVNLPRECNLLSLDDSMELPLARRSLSDSTGSIDPRIHAKGIIVYGAHLPEELMSNSLKGSESMNMNSWSEMSPKVGRFRVPVETERLMWNDRILDQYLSPTGPPLAGFRLDAFNIIRRRVIHSPSSIDFGKWDPFLTYLEDFSICPPILYIQVSVFQLNGVQSRLGEFRLPQARAGTVLYFDFPRVVQAQRVIFKLTGDVTAFIDEQTDLDESRPIASGLSLSANRVKLFYYADPSQLGALAALSAV